MAYQSSYSAGVADQSREIHIGPNINPGLASKVDMARAPIFAHTTVQVVTTPSAQLRPHKHRTRTALNEHRSSHPPSYNNTHWNLPAAASATAAEGAKGSAVDSWCEVSRMPDKHVGADKKPSPI